MSVRLVRQKDEYGCLVACLAMVTGHTYDDVRGRLNDIGLCFDAAAGGRGGMTVHDAEFYLGDHGFAYALRYRWRGDNRPRPEWPTAPFAPVHVLGVNGGGRHGVVLLETGAVFDPMHDEPRRLSDYEVSYMLGVWRLGRVSGEIA